MGFMIILSALGALFGIAVLVVLWGIAIYNRLVRHKNMVEVGWSGIDVQLKRRANLIPNLVETVKGYMGHESDVLKGVTESRSQSMNAGNPHDQGVAEGLLGAALGRLFAVAENYPDLKANQNFIELQGSLEETEEQIQLARRYYNGAVRELNTLIESFPSNIVAGMYKFQQAQYFEIEDEGDRAVPQVSFDD